MTRRVLLTGAVLALLSSVFAFRASSRMPDFEVYWRSGARAAAAEPLYRTEDEHYQLKYLPAFAVLAIPAAALPLPAAKALWFTASAVLLGAALALSLGSLRVRHKPGWLLVTLTLLTMAKFYGHELVLGQVNLLFVVVILAALGLLLRTQEAASGAMVALAIVIKPYAIIFLPWLFARRAPVPLAWAFVGLAAALALPAAIYGLSGTVSLHQEWWHTVTTSTAPNLLNADNVSLAAMYAKWLGPGPLATRLTLLTAAALLAAAALVVVRRRGVESPDALEVALLLTLIPLLSPQGWDYVFLISTPAVMYLINHEAQLPPAIRAGTIAALLVIAFSLYDVLGREAYGTFMALSVISVCYLVVLAGLVTLRLRGLA
ncbi:hypothetical protein BH24ACI4_BH24ACI4_01820 [soil metagenome]